MESNRQPTKTLALETPLHYKNMGKQRELPIQGDEEKGWFCS